MLEDDIALHSQEYPAMEKAELNRRINYYLTGGKMVTYENPTEGSKKKSI